MNNLSKSEFLRTITCNDAFLLNYDLVDWVNAQEDMLKNILRLPADMVAQVRHDMLLQVNAIEAMHKARLAYEALEASYEISKDSATKAKLHKADEAYEKAWADYKAGGWQNCHRG